MRTEFTAAVAAELSRARSLHAPHHSLHEALAVLWEEFEEVKAEVFRRDADRGAVLSELIQLAAMCQRAAEDCRLLEADE